MKFSFTLNVPMRDRLKILWLGGLHLTIDYKGQHEIARCTATAIHSRDVSPKVEKVKNND